MGRKEDFDLQFQREALPAELEISGPAPAFSGTNRSDDLFTFTTKKISRLRSNRQYEIALDVTVATNAGKDRIGAGGDAWKGVTFKTGASRKKPKKTIPRNGPD